MKSLKLTFIISLIYNITLSQHYSCDGSRYKNLTFTAIDSTMSVSYGSNTTVGGNLVDLKMDIYYPQGDTVSKRPLIVFAHGGGFIAGTRTDMRLICEYFSLKGFVTATITYRLLDVSSPTVQQRLDEIIKAQHDMKAAIRFFRENASTTNDYKIDPNFIFAGGISAGAYMANHVGMMDSLDNINSVVLQTINNNGGFEGNTNNFQQPSNVQGILNYSGAIGDTNWIDINTPLVYSAHDEFDGVVSCGSTITGHGSCSINPKAASLNKSGGFYLVSGSTGHVSYFYNQTQGLQVLQESSDFLYDILCTNASNIKEENSEASIITLYPNPARDFIQLNSSYKINQVEVFSIEGKKVLSQIGNRKSLNITELPKGTYFVVITTNDKQPISEILIKE